MRQQRTGDNRSGNAAGGATARRLAPAILPLLLLASAAWAAQNAPPSPAQPLPEAPQPHTQAQTQTETQAKAQTALPAQNGASATAPCKPSTPAASATQPAAATPGAATQPGSQAVPRPCPPPPPKNWFARFLTGPEVKPLTPKEKARLAVRNLLDPFNAVTIAGNAGIAIGSDARSPYGPGMPGFGRYVGVSYAEDMTSEVFGTFLIPSLTHQDPHYHRMPNASIPRRALHAVVQIAWTQGDNNKGMLNYANLVGSGIENEIINLYVPGLETNGTATASRYAIGLATAPVDNFITEFVPDVARRIHVRIILVQRIINQVATTESPASQ